MVTMNQVAQYAKVSRATVSRVLSGHPSITPETRANVMYWVKKLDYKPNKIAQSLASSKSHIIGVIVPSLSNPFFAEIVNAIELEAMLSGYSIIISSHSKNSQKEGNIINTLLSRKVDGIIMVPIVKEKACKTYNSIDVPIVSVTKKLDNFDSVLALHSSGVHSIVEHFIDMGHKKIGYVGMLKDNKFEALKNSVKTFGAELTDIIACEIDDIPEHDTVYKNVKKYIENNNLKSTALFAHNDVAASEVIQALHKLGYSIPKDVSVAGFDNTILSMKVNPKLTTVAQPTKEIGKNAVEMLINKINNLTEDIFHIELEPRIIVRESTLKINKNIKV